MKVEIERVVFFLSEKRGLFEKLVEQIQLNEEERNSPLIVKGELEKVIVHRQSKIWEFTLKFPTILPALLYRAITQKTELAFKDIAGIKINILAEDSSFDERILQDYWNVALQNHQCDTPLTQQVLKTQVPVMKDRKIILSVDNAAVIPYLKQQAFPLIEELYQSFGFSKFHIEPEMDEKQAEIVLKQFEERKQEQEQAFMQQAAENIANHEQLRKEKKEQAPALSGPIQLGRNIPADEPITPMANIVEEERRVTIEGYVFDTEVRELRSKRKILIVKITDYTSSFIVKKFSNGEKDEQIFDAISKGSWLKVRGSVQEDTFMRDLVMNAQDLLEVKHAPRKDYAPEGQKRVELHLHSNMSTMDATNNIGDFVAQAGKWGHKAIAITDHAGAQSFPDAHSAGKKAGVKILYGVEANVVDDGVPIAYNDAHVSLNEGTYIVFDVETTGLSAVYDTIIELAAVKMHKGNVIATFDEFIDPGHPLSHTTVNLTGITDEMVRGSKSEEEVLRMFLEFTGDDILVAHNASFDMGFLNTSYGKYGIPEAPNPVIDTLELARYLYPQFKRFGLGVLSKKFGVSLEQHHRAIYDAEATGHLAWIFVKEAMENHEMLFHDQLNMHIGEGDSYKRARPFHVTILAQTQAGLKNLFKLISMSNVNYFERVPRIPRSQLIKLREGLLVGSACDKGEIFEAMMQKGVEEAKNRAKFYDYIEIMPKAVYAPLIEQELVKNTKDLEDIMKNLVKIGKELGKIVVATGNVHYLNEEDAIYRKILINSMGGANPLNRHSLPAVHFRTTDEMLTAFQFMGEELAMELVVTNPNKIADMCEEVIPVKDDLYTPKIPGSEQEITDLSYNRAKELYGDPLPDIVEKRLKKELDSIIGNGFSVIYLISQKLVHKSNEDGYLVGSRGSVGSSFVATMTGITEVNPLAPHYHCPECKYSEFYEDGSYGSGFDMPEKKCPNCGARLFKDGHDIPFETFLGFHGDKVPDIDLNFSGDYQAEAHNYTKVLFGEDYVFRAGTIGTVADKTAYGFVKGYERDNNLHFRGAEVDRLAKGATGVKRTTGQHPGGIIVIPDYMDVYDFTPIQFPADDQSSEWKTTHFDFHSIHDNILKLDILGHDDPTVIRMLQDLSGIEPKTIPTDDPEVMRIFAGPEVLGVEQDQIFSKTGTLGIPEFGTRFVRGMLEETHPSTFAELLQISGLSHGTDVWLGNAEELIRRGEANLAQVIGCRDDIMVYLIHAGLDSGMAFKIMETVRKGQWNKIPDDLRDTYLAAMKENNVPDWYIDSCSKIKYMFPKAHAAAYVLMALRVAYFKVYFPILYYCAYFSVRADDFDLVAMSKGKEAVKERMKEITDKGMDASTKEKNLLTVLELANEMIERGFNFGMIDLYKSDAENFVIDGNRLIAPFRAVPSLGANVAKQIVEARKDGPFLSKEDLATRGKVSKTLIEYMTENGVLKDLPDENQLSLFDML
ncbi:DNA polymerase III, alpha subunit, Gram-positive type [Enterococcus phoeniculicola ATCC BAA-412]|jgi:DNA polymerase-3 subunit alpha (Gram-positive type)|uniref:DNA polymerase III PolC-type n=1 Tax=Enterococcus phoeniculicola ATCC BAA-412 TaxID=1158610 RepID=R3U2N8_9ENTE|nr:DNA polymerase III, alpha subunit, Gram-positive type [Enterococcus phoeniculicola ATCC BAA-412]EOT72938.1 DNA polymerase III, alpha subunit, Gram-positive type [Enterococcus phoeniculicola ATCC BAA-412]